MAAWGDGAVREYMPSTQQHLLAEDKIHFSDSSCLMRLCVEWVVRNYHKISSRLSILPVSLRRILLAALVEEKVVSDEHLVDLVDESFTSLRFDGNKMITDQGLCYVAKTCPRLSSLSLRDCPSVTHKGLISVFSSCPLVAHLDIGHSDGMLQHSSTKSIRMHCRALSSLCLDKCSSLRERDLIHLIKTSGGFLRTISLSNCSEFCTDKVLTTISQSCSQLDYISFANVTSISVLGVASVARHCTKLSHMDLSGTKLHASDLQAILHASHNLISLNLSFIAEFTDDVVTIIANCCPNLEDLRVIGVQGWTGSTLTHLFRNCGLSLKRLFLDNSKDLKNESFLAFKELRAAKTLLDEIDADAKKLRTRSFSDPPPPTTTKVTFVPRYAPSKKFRCALETISLCGGRHIQDSGLEAFFSLCPNLSSLNISGLPHITDKSAFLIAKHYQKQVIELDVSLCPRLTDVGVARIAESCGSGLSVLRLYGNINLTNVTLHALAAHTTQLTYLSLYGCKSFSDEGVESLISKSCHNLGALDLSSTKITNKSMKTIAATCSSLEVLRVNTCTKITGAGIATVALACPLLKYINGNNCHVKDEHLSVVARSCQSLQTLSLSSNENISDIGFLLCARGLPRLKKFILSCASAVSGEAIRIAKSDRPDLDIVFV